MESDPTGQPTVKPQPSPSKLVTFPVSEKKDVSTAAQKEPVVKKQVTDKQEMPKNETVTLPIKRETPQRVSTEKKQIIPTTEPKQGQEVSDRKALLVQPSPKPKPEIKTSTSKQEESGKPPPQPPKSTPPTAKSTPPPAAQPAKQEAGGFFGFGGPKTQPTKSSESMKGKMLGFGSSIFSSASTLITSAVQDEPKTTPPTPRKMSTSAQAPETQLQSKVASSAKVLEEKDLPEPPKVATKDRLSTCPLCKVELNMGNKDPPNYNRCTECKNTVCNLCGFNPTPHTGAVSPMKHVCVLLTLISCPNPSITRVRLLTELYYYLQYSRFFRDLFFNSNQSWRICDNVYRF